MSDVPMDLEAEQMVIAACLVEPEIIPEMSHIVQPGDFYREHNGWMYEAILEVWRKDADAVNVVTVAYELSSRNRLEEAGGQTRMHEYIRALPFAAGAESYGEIVRSMARARRAVSLLHNISQQIRQDPAEVDDLVDQSIEKMLAANNDRPKALTRTLADVITGGLNVEIDAFVEDPTAIRGLRTGVDWFDGMMNGLRPGALYVILADTSVGKSLFVHNLIRELSLHETPSLLFTTEMDAKEVTERVVFQQARVDPYVRRKAGMVGMEDRTNIAEAVATLVASASAYMCDLGGIPLATLQAEARRLVRTRGVEVVFVDHIQHVRVPGIQNPVQRIEEVTGGLKALALQESIPVVAVSHINRDAQKEGIRHSSGKGGSSIEQDADVVMSIEAMTNLTGEWEVASKTVADRHLHDYGWIPVKLTNRKARAGGAASIMLALDWRKQGGRFVPMAGER